MSTLQSEKFFNDSDISGIKNNESIQYEKIKLEFSILHAEEGSYSIQGKLYDGQVLDFTSEVKKSKSMQKLIFEKFFICDFHFEKQQNIQITINKNNTPIEINTTLGNIIGSINGTFTKNFVEDESLVIKAEKLGKDEDLLNIKITLKNNSDPKFFINNKLYYLITCRNNDIYKSAEITNNGIFAPIQIPTCLLQPSYKVSFYNFSNKAIFTFNRTTQKVKAKEKFQVKIRFLNDKYLILEDHSEVIKKFTFLDYITAGIRIALSIGIDFTETNGNPLLNGTLHSIQGNTMNNYEKAIATCGNILGYYNHNQLFPVYGFGAKINSSYNYEISNCFHLNFSDNPKIHTIDNVLKAYRDCIHQGKLTFAGPSQFAPLIRKVISRINIRDIFEYHILMILTDGFIDDLQQTIDVLVEASLLPLSVIIVGIGNADFKKMDILDGDEVPLTSSTGKKRMRDLVQFVPFYKYQNNVEQLAMEVLAEIPRQIVEYYQFKNLNPNQIGSLIKNSNNKNYNQNFNIQMRSNTMKNLNQHHFPVSIDYNYNNPLMYSNPINVINNYQNLNIINNTNYNQNINPGYKRSYTQGNDIYYQERLNKKNNNNPIKQTYKDKDNHISIQNNKAKVSNKNNSNISNSNNNISSSFSALAKDINLDDLPVNETVHMDQLNN